MSGVRTSVYVGRIAAGDEDPPVVRAVLLGSGYEFNAYHGWTDIAPFEVPEDTAHDYTTGGQLIQRRALWRVGNGYLEASGMAVLTHDFTPWVWCDFGGTVGAGTMMPRLYRRSLLDRILGRRGKPVPGPWHPAIPPATYVVELPDNIADRRYWG